MRLINAQTREMKDYIEGQIPPYAILSHTWGAEEVTYADYQNPARRQTLTGYAKIDYACEQAPKDYLNYVWIDTCCIDKSSSAELSEAINSMYRWYKKSSICYAFLEDLDVAPDSDEATLDLSLAACRWFTRGWTLQELIAPDDLVIYGQGWVQFGTKRDKTKSLSLITGIDEAILTGPMTCREASVARRMSWAAKRLTTRTEDAAYSLLGIFDINMPLLYGEGRKAFLRLQEEILKQESDMTILAWGTPNAARKQSQLFPYGALATDASYFAHCADYVPFRRSSKLMSVTAQGLSIYSTISSGMLHLGCRHRNRPGSQMSILVRRINKQQYVRHGHFLDERKGSRSAWQTKIVYLLKTDIEASSHLYSEYSFWNMIGVHDGWESLFITIKETVKESRATLLAVTTTRGWESPQTTIRMPTLWGHGFAVLHFQIPQSSHHFAVLIGRLGHHLEDLLMFVDRSLLRPAYTLIRFPDVGSLKAADFKSETWRRAQKVRHKLAVHHTGINGQMAQYVVRASLRKDKAMGRGAFYLEVKALRSE
ncbi:hypothetical protein FKW77_000987 [Venturia effusa]|uniref:Heterokaryon incompatibility domain-containing protein n=1 Tax=Venturia effusa TaxID=50376 RepID=A0A517LAC2_9PEZI|nr:hypothetical protein FKW77_000987 [Venturia effusa]